MRVNKFGEFVKNIGHFISAFTAADVNNYIRLSPFRKLMLSDSLKSHSDIYKILISPEDDFYLPDSVIKGIVIRAAAFNNQGDRVSPVVTQSYFIKSLNCDLHNFSVVSICADSLALFDYDTGIMVPGAFLDPNDPQWTGNYYQEGRSWERLCNVEYYTTGNEGFNQQAGLRQTSMSAFRTTTSRCAR